MEIVTIDVSNPAPPPVNQAPIWQNVPNLSFTENTPAVFPTTGTYQSNNYVTDSDNDPISITKNTVPVQGLAWDGGKFTFDGTGSAQVVTGHILTANDGQGHMVQSPAFSVTIIEDDYVGWNPDLAIITIPVGGSFALTNEYNETVGETPNFSIVAGEAALQAAGVTLINGVLQHDGTPNPGTSVLGTQYESSSVTAPEWIANPDLTFTQGLFEQVNLVPLLANFNATTDAFSFTPGSTTQSWLTISGNVLRADGTQTDANDFSGLRIRVTRSGLTDDTPSLSVTVGPPAAGGSLSYVQSHSPLLAGYGYPINFGKHTSWAQGTDGNWYTFSGDGNHAGIASYGGSSRWWRWYPNNPTVIDYYYPRVGIPGKENPCNPDCHPWVRRANGEFIGPAGKAHGWAGERDAPPFGPDIGITIPGPTSPDPATDVYYNWKYNPSTQTWTKAWNADFNCNENNNNESYNPATDEFYWFGDQQFLRILNCETLAVTTRTIPNLYAIWGRQQQQIYCPETNELFFIDTVGALGGGDTNGVYGIWAINVTTGVRRVLASTGLIYSNSTRTSGLGGQAGSTPFVFVPSRRRLYIFLWEWFDYSSWHNDASYNGPLTIDGGIMEFTFNPGYTSYTLQNIPYPTVIRDYASTLATEVSGRLHKSVFINNAFYDPIKDRIYGINGNGVKIFEWRWI